MSPIGRLSALLPIWVLLVWSPLAAAQETTTVTGTVINGATALPIPDVRIESEQETVTTGPDGRFSVVLREGETTLRFRADGYQERILPVEGADLEVRLFPNTFTETVEVVAESIPQ